MLTLVAAPPFEPITLAQAKAQCRMEIDDDDMLISYLIAAARQKCESYLSRSFVATGWRLTMDGFPGTFSRFAPGAGSSGPAFGPLYGAIPEQLLAGSGQPILIAAARLMSVSAITYLDVSGVRRTLDPSAYSVEAGDGGRITPAYGTSWPAAQCYPGSVAIDFLLGYGPLATDVPAVIGQAILLTISHLYEHREAVTDAGTFELTMGAKWLLAAEDWGCRP